MDKQHLMKYIKCCKRNILKEFLENQIKEKTKLLNMNKSKKFFAVNKTTGAGYQCIWNEKTSLRKHGTRRWT